MENPFAKVRNEHIFAGAACVIQVAWLRISARRSRPEQRSLRYRIRDAAKLAFIFAEFFLSLFESFDVGALFHTIE